MTVLNYLGNLRLITLSDPQTVAALHAPTSVQWEESIEYPFNSTYTLGDISVLNILSDSHIILI